MRTFTKFYALGAAKCLVVVCAAAMAVTSCGSGTNLMQIWADDDGVDSLLVRARAAYDRGSFTEAATLAEGALRQDSQNESGAIILGYISLAQGGMDSFSLLEKLISLGKSGTNLAAVPEKLTGHWEVDLDLMSDAIAKDAAMPQEEIGTEPKAATSSLTGTMDKMKSLVSLTDADRANLSSAYTDGTTYGKAFYADYPLVNPQPVNAALRGSVPLLTYMNRIPSYLCGFVEDSVRDVDDPRDSATTCPTSDRRTSKRKGSIHLIWAFSHIGEALAFYNILNYSSGISATAKTSNLEGRVALYKSKSSFPNLGNMVDASTDLIGSIDTIFPSAVSGSISQLSATLSAMNSASQAFAAMSSSTSSISKGISTSMTALKTTAGSISGVSDSAKQQGALKGQFTSSAVTALSAQILAQYPSAGSAPSDLCAKFTALAGNTPGVTKPTSCP